ncbi:MAG TPA: hypothetical protein VK880_06275 [Anaerolineales bacterium]|nr:hypothetical protein [Anaerolineales bacterium]
MDFNFGEVLARAWQITWKHKVLWIFGILASCGRGGGGGNGGGGNTGFETQGPDLPPQAMQWFQFIEENLAAIIGAGIALICLIWIITIFLSTVGRIGLIRGASQVDRGTESLNFGQLFSESLPYFWRVFGLSLIIAIPILIVLAALLAGLITFAISASQGSDAAIVGIATVVPLFIGCICILIPVMFVVGMIIRQAERAIVLEDLSLMPGLSRGWDVFRNNLGPIILVAIILVVIGLVVGFVIAIPIFIAVLPAMFSFIVGESQNFTPLIFMGVFLCLYIPVSLLLNGIATAYSESVWTLTYLRLTKPQANTPAIIEANA